MNEVAGRLKEMTERMLDEYEIYEMESNKEGTIKKFEKDLQEIYNLGKKGKGMKIKDNHTIRCELESYVNILEQRGFHKEARILDEIASKLK